MVVGLAEYLAVPSGQGKPAASLQDAAGKRFDAPVTLEQLRDLLAESPDVRLVAGSTDLALGDHPANLKTLPHLRVYRAGAELQCHRNYDEGLVYWRRRSYPPAPVLLLNAKLACLSAPCSKRLGSLADRNRGTLAAIWQRLPDCRHATAADCAGAQIQLDSVEGTRCVAAGRLLPGLPQDRPARRVKFILYRAACGSHAQTHSTAVERLFIYRYSKVLDDDISARCWAAFWFQFDGDQILDCRPGLWRHGSPLPSVLFSGEALCAVRPLTMPDLPCHCCPGPGDFSPMSDRARLAAYAPRCRHLCCGAPLLEYKSGATAITTDW